MFENSKKEINENIVPGKNAGTSATGLKETLLTVLDDARDAIADANFGIIGAITTSQELSVLNSFPDGVYEAQTSGLYKNGLAAKEGYYTRFRKTANTWSLESETKIPMQDLTAIETKVNNNEKKVDEFIRDFAVEVDNTFDVNSQNPIANKEVSVYNNFLNDKLNIDKINTTEPTENIVTLINNVPGSVSSFYTNSAKFIYENFNLLYNKTIKRLRFDVLTPGKFTIFKVLNPKTNNSVFTELLTLDLVVGEQVYDVNIILGNNETLAFGKQGDTAIFKFIATNVNNIGGGFYAYSHSGTWVALANNNLNIGIDCIDTTVNYFYESTTLDKIVQLPEILDIKGGSEEVQLLSAKSGLSVGASMTNSFNYTTTNYRLMYGLEITKVVIYIQKAGTFSIFKAKNINTTNFTRILIGVYDVVVGFNELDISTQLEAYEALVFGDSTDTCFFFFEQNSVDSSGGTVIWQLKSSLQWSGGANNLNIGVFYKSNDVPFSNKLKKIEEKINSFNEKKISFIGDSITTFKDYIPTGNATFYPTNNVTNVDQTWWKLLLSKLNADLVTNDSWSGSRVSNSGSGSLQTRFNKIATTTEICFVFMGTNDFGNNVSLGNLDFTTDFTTTEFSDAYCNALQNLITNYPTTRFIVMTPLKRNYNNTFPTKNNTYTLDSMCDKVLEICKIYGVDCIDMRNCGINQYNHSTYLFDGLHPNAKGMELIANFIFNKL